MSEGPYKIERHVPCFPHCREVVRRDRLRRALVLYRMVFGQSRQEDLVHFLSERLAEADMARVLELCRVDLTPPESVGTTVIVSTTREVSGESITDPHGRLPDAAEAELTTAAGRT